MKMKKMKKKGMRIAGYYGSGNIKGTYRPGSSTDLRQPYIIPLLPTFDARFLTLDVSRRVYGGYTAQYSPHVDIPKK